MGSGWTHLIPRFQKHLDVYVGQGKTRLRLADRRPDGSLDVSCLQGANVLIPTTERCDYAALDSCRATLQLIYQPFVGIDLIDIEAARKRSVALYNAPKANSTATAEGALLMMLAAARCLPQVLANVHEGVLGAPAGMQLHDRTVGIVGRGNVGKAFAEVCAGIGMKVKNINSKSSREAYEELLRDSDVVSLHIPLSSETRGFIGKAELALMRRGSILVNVGRGDLIERAALEEALDAGHLRAVAMDCFWNEPADPADPFLKRSNVFVTSHSASATEGFYSRISEGCSHAVLSEVYGHRLPEHAHACNKIL